MVVVQNYRFALDLMFPASLIGNGSCFNCIVGSAHGLFGTWFVSDFGLALQQV